MSKTATLSNGQSIWTSVITGEVIESSQTHVTSIEQGDHTLLASSRGGATLIPGRISSRTDVEHELWLRMSDGKEKAFQFQNVSVPYRAGHRVSLLAGGPVGLESGWYFGARNHTTGTTNVSFARGVDDRPQKWGLEVGAAGATYGAMAFCIATGAAIGAMTVYDKVGGAIFGAVLGFFASLVLAPVFLKFFILPRAESLIQEIEEVARQRLAERDA